MAKKRFENINPRNRHRFASFIRWQFGLMDEPFAFIKGTAPNYKPEIVSPNLGKIQNPDKNKIQVTWIGHSSFLIQFAEVNILTDPHFSKRASPFQWLGPVRYVKPALKLGDLPKIDFVVISHDHYDHLDFNTVKALGNEPTYIVPTGIKEWFKKKLKILNVEEKGWWESGELNGVNFTSVPVRHFSGRVPFYFNTTLWTGWVLEINGKKIFFAGDTGYANHFKEIYEKFGAIDLAFIPIGAYHPRWFMEDVHVSPKEAVQIHEDIHSRQSIGMHWGTFRLTGEPMMEPPLYLKHALRNAGFQESDFVTMMFGETRLI